MFLTGQSSISCGFFKKDIFALVVNRPMAALYRVHLFLTKLVTSVRWKYNCKYCNQNSDHCSRAGQKFAPEGISKGDMPCLSHLGILVREMSTPNLT